MFRRFWWALAALTILLIMIRPVELCSAWSSEEDKEREYHRKKFEKYGPRGTGWPDRLIPDLPQTEIPDKPSVRKTAPVDYTNVTNATDFNESLSDVGRTLVELESNYRFER